MKLIKAALFTVALTVGFGASAMSVDEAFNVFRAADSASIASVSNHEQLAEAKEVLKDSGVFRANNRCCADRNNGICLSESGSDCKVLGNMCTGTSDVCR